VCRGEKIIIPESLQQQVVDIAHEAHQGVTKTKQYVRATMWFARMDAIVEEKLQNCTLCQATTDSVAHKEPIHPTIMPQQPWNTVCSDLFGPLPTGEYLVLVQCLQSRFPEVAITHSTSAAAVIPAIDKILAAYGTPEELGSDNGPPFNSQEFTRFARKLGFRHRKVTPLAPWANGTAERFMKSLGKVVQIAHADHKNWRHELTKFLRAYRATPHTMTGVPPATLMFNGRRYATNLPSLPPQGAAQETEVLAKARQTDQAKKEKMKQHADNKAYVKTPDIKEGDRVLVKQKKTNKLSTAYEVEPYTVDQVNGSQITASNHIHQVTRHVNLFKKLIQKEEEEGESEVELNEETGNPRPGDGGATTDATAEGEAQAPQDSDPTSLHSRAEEELTQEGQQAASSPTPIAPPRRSQRNRQEVEPSNMEPPAPLRRSQRKNVLEPARYPAPERDTSQ
jgi:hypothetical protein